MLAGACTLLFDVAYVSYLPDLVPRERLLEGNSRLAASASVAEVSAFGLTGWLVQWLTAPIAILIDAASFVVSAVSLATIRAPEPVRPPAGPRASAWREIADGLRSLAAHPTLRPLVAASVTQEMSYGFGGAAYLLFVTRELGFRTGVLGLIFAVGGVSSLLGSLVAGPAARRFGSGPAMAAGLVISALAALCTPLAHGTAWPATGLLLTQQLVGDGAATLFAVLALSLRQEWTPPELRGRVNAAARCFGLTATLVGSLAAGWLAERIGLRAVLFVAAGLRLVASLWIVGPALQATPRPAGGTG